jgi:hypothetical protein
MAEKGCKRFIAMVDKKINAPKLQVDKGKKHLGEEEQLTDCMQQDNLTTC